MAMLDISLECGTKKTEILNDFCAHHGYQSTIKDAQGQDIPNPITKAVFAKSKIADYVKECVRSYRCNKVADDARKASIADTDATITIA